MLFVNLSADSLFDAQVLDCNESDFDDAERLRGVYHKVIHRYVGTQVTHILLNANYQRTCYPGNVWKSFWEIQEPDRNVTSWRLSWLAHEAGVEVFDNCIEHCRANGISPWMSMRMNDWHYLDDSTKTSPLWEQHPEYRLSNRGTFDFTHREVREYHTALAYEMMERYDVDGIELDWMRGPPFFAQGEEHSGCELLTEFMRSIRNFADQRSKQRGRPLQISVRVPGVPEHARGVGLDAATWAREGLVDVVVPTAVWMPTDFDMPMEQWRDQIGDIPLLAGADLWVQCVPGGALMRHDLESSRGFVASMMSRGADGIYLFNHFNEPKDFRRIYIRPDGTKYTRYQHRDLMSQAVGLESSSRGPRRHVLTFRNTVPPGTEPILPLPMTVTSAGAKCRLHTGPVPDIGKALLRVGCEDAAAAVAARVNDVECCPLSDLDESSKPDPEDKKDEAVWSVEEVASRVIQFDIPLDALSGQHNEIELRTTTGDAVCVTWLEVRIS